VRKRIVAVLVVGTAAAVVSVARSGHELPIYPSFYPHEIEIRTFPPDQAAEALRDGRIQAHIGTGPALEGAPPERIGGVESLGDFVVVRLDPQSPLAADEAAACAALKAIARQASETGRFIVHPYPVTPFHGDYFHHADRAADAKRNLFAGDFAVRGLKIRAPASLQHPDWSADATDWDIEVIEVDAAGLVASATLTVNGWIAPPWLRAGWFHAERLLADPDPALRQRLHSDLQRLRAGEVGGVVERINLEREVLATLTQSCRSMVAGYTVKREYVNVEYSAGIENIGYDAIEGLRSPIFIRTVKLKDFPWNGWLALGIGSEARAAWNPIGGMTDSFGRLLGFAVGDPGLLPSPYEAGWMLNRIADLPQEPGQ
jgi:hypothetical protein